MPLVYLLTDSRFVDPEHPDWYVQQILDEDRLLSDALLELGIDSKRVDWADDRIDWKSGDAAVVRTTWDYFSRFNEFDRWLNKVSKLIPFINPISLLRWNLDKHYLQDLADRGFPIVPSIFIEKGSNKTLAEIHATSGWDQVVLKPCVSGGAYHTYRVSPRTIAEHEAILTKLLTNESMMLQEFHETILDRGEVSHMVMNGKYTHSVLKKSKGSDFRVQDDFGGTVHDYTASEAEKKLAEAVFASCEPLPVYGRLDIMWDSSGAQMIGELEIIEPELWMRKSPESATEFAKGISASLDSILS